MPIREEKLQKIIIYFVSLAAGTLLGDAFIHLIPESFKVIEETFIASLYILLGIFSFFILEKYLHWRHCHRLPSSHHRHPFSYIILLGDGVHNFIDGMVIAASFLISLPVGVATTLAVILHEIPHEIGNFGSLVYGGFSKNKAIFFNFLSALSAILGALVVLGFNFETESLTRFLIPFAAGGFIYVAGSDLIPELHKCEDTKQSFIQIGTFLIGIGLMAALFILE